MTESSCSSTETLNMAGEKTRSAVVSSFLGAEG